MTASTERPAPRATGTAGRKAPPLLLRLVLGNITLTALLIGALGTAALGLAVPALDGWRTPVRAGLALLFLVAASGRLGPPRAALVAMVPPRLPRPALLVGLTGALEALGAVGLLVPATDRLAAGCLGLLLIAVFPANVYAARHRVGLHTALLPRTLEQLLYLACCAAVALSN
ncbi:DoxX family protein [Actinocatenispora comari]|uniref:DoxX family protein n=1 Tax=Actinocatenispora comari TaxID=2807577 RepID=A0A8J4AJ31_9ACTN|nr:DoxX family protein [Actinocatenispora comari]GIL31684.1 hypothetical protein NUM_69380 [Actinocatenispora comari]